MLSIPIVALLSALAPLAASRASARLPTVDLGYEVHQAILHDSAGGFYNFSNIRYARPPVGKLRWQPPLPPQGRSAKVNAGREGRICPQAYPIWEHTATLFAADYLEGKAFNESAAKSHKGPTWLPAQDPRTTEDCLFLDVVVPEKILPTTKNSSNSTSAPVLVWIYGGGYTEGDKSAYSAAGLIKASQAGGSEGIIFVSLNYRLGAFGWLSGPTLQSNGIANAGLYDQRLALEWVQTNIHLFGGDPNRVTVIGQSAGGGSIMHQITAFGGLKGPVPFQQAILQSPGFQPVVGDEQQEQTFQHYLSLLNVSTLDQARSLPFKALQKANSIAVRSAPYGLFTFGPVVDGRFAPATPGKLLLEGSYDKNLTLMLGHNADEGLFFTDPSVTNNASYDKYLHTNFPTISSAVATYIQTVLYPPKMPGVLGTTGYSDETGRVVLTISESGFTCNTKYLTTAFPQKSYAYQFSVPPALHGQDVPYTFYLGPSNFSNSSSSSSSSNSSSSSSSTTATISNPSLATALQEYITSFAIDGKPSGGRGRGGAGGTALPLFPLYDDGKGGREIDFGVDGVMEIGDPVGGVGGERCEWWERGLYV